MFVLSRFCTEERSLHSTHMYSALPSSGRLFVWRFIFFQNSKAEVTLEGFLVVSWGIKRPIRLKIQDEKHSDSSKSPGLSPGPVSPLGNKRWMFYSGLFNTWGFLFHYSVHSLIHPFTQGYDPLGRIRQSSSHWRAGRNHSRWCRDSGHLCHRFSQFLQIN